MSPKLPAPRVRYTTVCRDRACPQCGRSLFRTWRRPVDRFTSMFKPVQRFRCEHFSCQWEGSVPVPREDFVSTDAEFGTPLRPRPARDAADLPWSFVIHTSLALAGLVLCVVLIATDTLVIAQQLVYDESGGNTLSKPEMAKADRLAASK